MTDFSRRTLVKGAFALGACSVLPGHNLFAQAAATSPARLIDVHQHYVSPDYFAVMTRLNGVSPVQGYGLWSGPTDHRRRPLIVNYGRNQFIRDAMVRHGDEHKAIWIAEMNWNAVPAGIAPNFGQVTPEQQANYAPLAYQRAQAEWPWVGMNAFWFFKRADDSNRSQAWYYFRMAEPDFTLLPVYSSMWAYTRQTPVMYPGYFQENHWAVAWTGEWQDAQPPQAVLGAARVGAPGAEASFTFDGTDLVLVTQAGPQAGTLSVSVDGGPARTFDLRAPNVRGPVYHSLAQGLAAGPHTVTLTSADGATTIDGFIVRQTPQRTAWLLAELAAVLGLLWWVNRRMKTEG